MTALHATAEANYLTRLALTASPFSRQDLPGAFFAGRTMGQRLNLILHLLRATDKISLIHAAQGMGKSALLRAIAEYDAEDFRLCLVQATPSLTLQHITQHCLTTFAQGTVSVETADGGEQALRHYLQQLRALHITPVLLIDDVDALNTQTRQQLSTWLHWQREGRYLLNAVFTCTEQSVNTLNNERFQLIELAPIPESELPEYLLQRLVAAGYLGELPFTSKQLKRIWQQSKGKPAEINHAAHQVLLGVRQRRFSLPDKFRIRRINVLPWVPVAIVLILVLLFQKQINTWLSQTDPTSAAPDAANLQQSDELASVILAPVPALTAVEQDERETLMTLLEELEQATEASLEIPLASEDMHSDAVTDSLEADHAVSAQIVPDDMPAETATDIVAEAVLPPPDEPDVPVESEPVIVVQNAAIQGIDWILDQQARRYTFQLMGSWEREELEAFVAQHQLTDNVAIFASMREEQVWYALLYGDYASREAALAAHQRWPEPLKSVPNWLRRFDGVQTQIREKPALP